MFSFTTAFFASTLAAGILASPAAAPSALIKRNTPNSSGTNNGYFYQFCMCNASISSQYPKTLGLTQRWGDDGSSGTTTYTNGPAGEYSVNWQNVGDFTAGKGWSQAEPRNITFSGSVNCGGNFYLSVYTWSTQGENYVGLLSSPTQWMYVTAIWPRTDSWGLRHLQSMLWWHEQRQSLQWWERVPSLPGRPWQQLSPELVRPPEQAFLRHCYNGKPLQLLPVSGHDPQPT